MKNLVVAIDGPAGAGKSTVSQLAAKKLGYTYLDTGAMYRAVAWKTLQQHKEVTDELILDVVKDIDVDLQYKDGKTTVAVDGTDVTGEIRTPEVSAIVSQVAALGPVRKIFYKGRRILTPTCTNKNAVALFYEMIIKNCLVYKTGKFRLFFHKHKKSPVIRRSLYIIIYGLE